MKHEGKKNRSNAANTIASSSEAEAPADEGPRVPAGPAQQRVCGLVHVRKERESRWIDRKRERKRREEEEKKRQRAIDRRSRWTSSQPQPQPPQPHSTNSSIALALTSALAAGVLGVEGWSGFLYYLAGQAVAASALWAKSAGRPEAFSASGSRVGLLVGESLGSTSLLTFILFWSLAHNYVHLF